jgi:uncharacterized protein YjbI with pentapeptide repeats
VSYVVHRPARTDEASEWQAYWVAQGTPWRTEPEIDDQRKEYLSQRRAISPDVAQGSYPFGGEQLSRADVEWLLATHQAGGTMGPVDMDAGGELVAREGLDLRGADLRARDLSDLPLARLRGGVTPREWLTASSFEREAAAIHLEDATLRSTHLEGAQLRGAHLERAYLHDAHLEGSELVQAHLEGAVLFGTWLQGRAVQPVSGARRMRRGAPMPWVLPPADLHLAYFDSATSLYTAHVGDRMFGGVRVADIRWNAVNLARTQWGDVAILGDELVARRAVASDGTQKGPRRRLEEYQTAARAYRQLAIALRGQGVSQDADRFAYRAQLLERTVERMQGHWARALGSWLLDASSGYGYRPLRSLIAYVAIIGLFAGAYLLNAQFAAPHLTWDEALVLSISSFHGRGFFSSGISLGDTLARLAAGEAILGLLIEITFIATFTQRFFAR